MVIMINNYTIHISDASDKFTKLPVLPISGEILDLDLLVPVHESCPFPSKI